MSHPKSSRRRFLKQMGSGGIAAGLLVAPAVADAPLPAPRHYPVAPRRACLLPQTNAWRTVLDLSGLWSFRPDGTGDGSTQGWADGIGGVDGKAVRLIAVPGSWNEQFQDLHDFEGYGWYETMFTVPTASADRRVVLRVGSAVYSAICWIDGREVGTHQGGHLPFEIEVSAVVKAGAQHRLVILVDARLGPDRVPMGNAAAPGRAGTKPDVPYDFFPYAGLHRAVTLTLLPDVHLADLVMTTSLDGADGIVRVSAVASNGWSGSGQARLTGPDGSDVTLPLRFRDGNATAELRRPTARLWHPNDPFLYELSVTLETAQGTTIDGYTLPVGIRTIAVAGDRLLLNGKAIHLRGAARHEDFPVNGRGLNLPVAVRDMELLRWIGGNSFRTSHYPYAEETLALADRLGILVIAEIPAVDLSFCDSPEAVAARLAQCRQDIDELVARDKNHPSVIMWSLANEPQDDVAAARSGLAVPPGNDAGARGLAFFRDLFAHARTLDTTRPFTLVGMDHSDPAWVDLGDVLSLNRYPGWYDDPGELDVAMPKLSAELERIHRRTGKPIILTEFGADAIAGQHDDPPALWSEEYQADTIEAVVAMAADRPWIAGLHVWCLCDFRTAQAVRRPENLNFKGIFTRDRSPKLAAHRLRHLWRADV